jgi:CheY-like chemotaxis protein
MPDDPRTARLLDNAIQGAHRGVSLTARMLAFSRRQPLAPQAVDLPGLVRGIGDLLKLSLGNNIALETQASLTVAPAIVDPNQLELALLNVAANARDAMRQGGTLTISVSNEKVATDQAAGLKSGSYVRLAVSDTGEGMDEETLARAIDPFFTTKGPGKGTGLGLSVVHGLLKDSGGRLVLRSRKGEGTTVEMWLPAAPSHQPSKTGSEEDATADAPSEAALTVLAVDDDELVLMNTATMLEDLGYRVIESHSGADALKQLSEREVDLIITDQGMPRMTGTELAMAARERHPDLPVILVTGYLDLPRGAADLQLPKLGKPFSAEQLQTIVRDTMERQGREQE